MTEWADREIRSIASLATSVILFLEWVRGYVLAQVQILARSFVAAVKQTEIIKTDSSVKWNEIATTDSGIVRASIYCLLYFDMEKIILGNNTSWDKLLF